MGPVREMLASSPVSEQKWRVLRVLQEAGPQDQNSITRILRVMEVDHLVSREEDPTDRRRRIVIIESARRGS